MRRTSLLSILILYAFAGCASSGPITVTRLGPGQKADVAKGDPVKVKRGNQEAFVGLRGGYYVVRSVEEWRNAWPTGKEPPLPATLDTSTTMLLLAVADQKDTAEVKIQSVVELSNAVNVTVKETKVGKNCSAKQEQTPFDALSAPRIDKPIKVYVEEEVAESCGEAPAVTLNCRLNDGAQWTPKISAQPGDKVECEMGAETRGKFALIDNVLSLGELPPGSGAKFAYTRGAARGAFTVDVFGSYTVRAESTDEGGRKTLVVANVEAVPQKTREALVQLVWTNFDPKDDHATFPRVKVRAYEEGRDAKNKPTWNECSAQTPRPELCDVKLHSANTLMKIKASGKKVPLEVLYVDERVDKGPLVCIQVYFDGARTGETCDRKHRPAEEKWSVGTLDMDTGKLLDPTPIAIADAGAEDPKRPAKPAAPAKPPAKK